MVSKRIISVLFLLMLAGAINVVAAPTIVTNFPIPSSSACAVAVNPYLNKIYVSGGAEGGQNVTVIDGITFAQMTVGAGSGVFSVDTANDQYWAGTVYGGNAIVRDGVTDETVTNIRLGYCPHEADVDFAHRRVWVGAQCGGGNDPVWAIDADTFAIIAGPIGTGGVLGPILVNPATGRLYVWTSGGSKRVNPPTFTVTANAFGQVVGANPVSNRLYVYSGSTLQIIDGAPDPELIVASVPLSFTPNAGYNIGVNTALNQIYIGCNTDNTLYTIDGASGAELGSVSLGTGISIGATAVDSTNGRIYVVVYGTSGPQLFVLEDGPPLNLPPVANAGPSYQVVQIGIDPIVVVADVADSDGDMATYQWLKGSEVLASGSVQTTPGGDSVQIPELVIQAGDQRFPVGVHQIELKVSDGVNPSVSSFVSVEVVDTTAPSISPVPSVTILWPPNHELQPVTIAANAFDNGGGVITLGVTVQSSEPADAAGDGSMIPDYYLDSVNDETGIIELRLRSERAGIGDGRVYKISITATDVSGNNSVAIVEIRAPHDRRKK